VAGSERQACRCCRCGSCSSAAGSCLCDPPGGVGLVAGPPGLSAPPTRDGAAGYFEVAATEPGSNTHPKHSAVSRQHARCNAGERLATCTTPTLIQCTAGHIAILGSTSSCRLQLLGSYCPPCRQAPVGLLLQAQCKRDSLCYRLRQDWQAGGRLLPCALLLPSCTAARPGRQQQQLLRVPAHISRQQAGGTPARRHASTPARQQGPLPPLCCRCPRCPALELLLRCTSGAGDCRCWGSSCAISRPAPAC
jgi:hypothetical protein